jgi:hypothetical protein
MQDEELTAIILRDLRDSRHPTGVEDIVAIARSNGVNDGYQIHRIGRRLRDQGLVDAVGYTEQSLQARINENGLVALESGDIQTISEKAKRALVEPRPDRPGPSSSLPDRSEG